MFWWTYLCVETELDLFYFQLLMYKKTTLGMRYINFGPSNDKICVLCDVGPYPISLALFAGLCGNLFRMPKKPPVTPIWCRLPEIWSPLAGFKCAVDEHLEATWLKFTPCTGPLTAGIVFEPENWNWTYSHNSLDSSIFMDLWFKGRDLG